MNKPTADTAHEDQLEAWLAREKQISAALDAGAGCGVATPAQLAGKSGLEIMQAMLRGELPYPPIARTLDSAGSVTRRLNAPNRAACS